MSNIISKIAVIGLGYVGLPLAYHLSKKFNVIGFDINKKRVQKLKSGYDLNNELNKRQLSFLLKNSLITSFEKDLSNCKMFM